MEDRRFDKEIRPELLQELLAAGLSPETTRLTFNGNYDGTGWVGVTACWLTCDDAHDTLAEQVVRAHSPAVYDAALHAERDRAAQAIAFLRNFRSIASGSATNAQRDNAIKALSVVAERIIAELRN